MTHFLVTYVLIFSIPLLFLNSPIKPDYLFITSILNVGPATLLTGLSLGSPG